ncbi:hypothetical protein [Pseudorhodoferax sp. Leaf274]|nr:hypothetical protein [Pseudorhodoferax sp. Leaf274]
MTREHLTEMAREAMHVLDMVRAGMDVPAKRITWALMVTGDLTLADLA